MSSQGELQGRILTPSGFVDGTITFDATGRIGAIVGTPVALQAARDTQARLILPGFIDLHVHGGGGHDVMEGGDAARHIAALHVRHGTTSMLPPR
jgi:N-acetylglucosamine-6-phosphate deacetylase